MYPAAAPSCPLFRHDPSVNTTKGVSFLGDDLLDLLIGVGLGRCALTHPLLKQATDGSAVGFDCSGKNFDSCNLRY